MAITAFSPYLALVAAAAVSRARDRVIGSVTPREVSRWCGDGETGDGTPEWGTI